jgi:hypothetical protein
MKVTIQEQVIKTYEIEVPDGLEPKAAAEQAMAKFKAGGTQEVEDGVTENVDTRERWYQVEFEGALHEFEETPEGGLE